MRRIFLFIFLFIAFAWYACNNKSNDNKQQIVAVAQTDLNAFPTELPEAEGFEAFKMNCVSCHSARYVQMQPNLSEKTWAALVTKMQKTFHAPIPDSSVNDIVQYLVSIKGK